MWPEEGNITDMARKREYKMIWQDVGNIIVVARRGKYNECGQKRVMQRMWPEEGL